MTPLRSGPRAWVRRSAACEKERSGVCSLFLEDGRYLFLLHRSLKHLDHGLVFIDEINAGRNHERFEQRVWLSQRRLGICMDSYNVQRRRRAQR